jgi:carbonic anhydrase
MPVDLNTQKAVFQPRSPLHWGTVVPKHILTALAAKAVADVRLDDDSISFNGHTVQVNPVTSPVINYEGKNYQLLQFHFHTPSENRIDGHASASEMHLVHRASDGSLLVGILRSLFSAAVITHPPGVRRDA